jgi:subtilisin family serine protease
MKFYLLFSILSFAYCERYIIESSVKPSNFENIIELPNLGMFIVDLDDDDEVNINSNFQKDSLVNITEFRTRRESFAWGLNRIDQINPPQDGSYTYERQLNSPVKLYILDTGVDAVPLLEGRSRFGANFVSGTNNNDNNGHGTHVAGIATASRLGVSDGPEVISVKVIGDDGFGSWADTLQGIDWVIGEARKNSEIAIINLSISSAYYQLGNNAVRKAVEAGIFVVVSAGNNG